MAFTYTAASAFSNPLFRARRMLGDVVEKDESNNRLYDLEDEEITSAINAFGFAMGVAQLAEGLAAEYSKDPDDYQDEAGVRSTRKARIQVLLDLANRLRTKGDDVPKSAGVGTGAAGGMTCNPYTS